MKNKLNLLVFAVVFAFVGTMALSSCNDGGKAVDGEATHKCGEGKCGEGKCGEGKATEKAGEVKDAVEVAVTDAVEGAAKDLEEVVDEHAGHDH
ncbi:MAG: putative low-complexity protein [Planctomycetota bacterium]|jgi:uncharacterized low-complexity protein